MKIALFQQFYFINYNSGIYKYNKFSYENNFELYNIFRDEKTTDYAKGKKTFS